MKILLDLNKRSGIMSLQTDDPSIFHLIRDKFSENIKNSQFSTRGQRKKYMITPTGRCLPGMYWEIRKFLRDLQLVVDIELTPSLKAELFPDHRVKYDNSIKYSLIPYDYQEVAIENSIKMGRGIIKLATGGGKTLITSAIIENYYRSLGSTDHFKCLVVVPDLGLVEQTYNELSSSGITSTCTRWTGSHDPDMLANIIVCNSSILYNRSHLDEYSWVEYVDLLIVDECHKIKSSSEITKIIKRVHTPRKYGLTGTLPDNNIDTWNIIGCFGPIIYEKNSKELRDEKYLTDVSVLQLDLHYIDEPEPGVSANPWLDEVDFISRNGFRNKIITKICNNSKNNILIMVNNISHGEILLSILTELTNKRVFFVRGDVDVSERENIKKLMEEHDDIICIAISAIFATGINVKNIHNIIFAAGGRSFIRIVQSIGRGLRRHKNKSRLIIIDIVDRLRYGEAHSVDRCEIYRKEKIKFKVKEIFER